MPGFKTGGRSRPVGIAARNAGYSMRRSTAQRLAGVGALDRARVGTKVRMDQTAWRKLKADLILIRGNRCQNCGRTECSLILDHIIPHARGGSDHPRNLKLICEYCDKNKIGKANRRGQRLAYGR